MSNQIQIRRATPFEEESNCCCCPCCGVGNVYMDRMSGQILYDQSCMGQCGICISHVFLIFSCLLLLAFWCALFGFGIYFIAAVISSPNLKHVYTEFWSSIGFWLGVFVGGCVHFYLWFNGLSGEVLDQCKFCWCGLCCCIPCNQMT